MSVTGVTSGEKLWTGLPPLVPCCEGQELQVDEECVGSGLSVISVREAVRVLACCSEPTPILKARNSFRCVHRPELRRAAGLRHLSPAGLRRVLLGASGTSSTSADSESRSALRASSARELPAGMRLHRARLFTAVLAAADAATAAPGGITDETHDEDVADDTQDDAVLDEEVQIILRPKVDEEAESSTS